MITWADRAQLEQRAATIDRDRDEGPPRCCAIPRVAADELVWWGGLPSAAGASLRAAISALAAVADADLFLCGSCRDRMHREKRISRETAARGIGLSSAQIAAAWRHDEVFYRRGPASAPPEAASPDPNEEAVSL